MVQSILKKEASGKDLLKVQTAPDAYKSKPSNTKSLNVITHRLIWREVFNKTLKDRLNHGLDEDYHNKIFGVVMGSTPATVAIHAEIIHSILRIKESQDYLIRPKHFVEMAIRKTIRLEQSI